MSHQLTPAVGAHDHAHGPDNALVTLVEYGDYECPHTGRAYPILKRAQTRMGSHLRFIFRNFPLTKMHPHAESAAFAAEAAGLQGKFWPMHDLLFENQQRLDYYSLLGHASKLRLDVGGFEVAYAGDAVRERVRADILGGTQSGVHGTPTLFANGTLLDVPWTEEDRLVLALEGLARKPASHKLPLIQIGDQVYTTEGGEELGAVRAVAPNGQPEIVVYVENSGEFVVPLAAVDAVHDGKVVLHATSLPAEMRAAIRNAHKRERD